MGMTMTQKILAAHAGLDKVEFSDTNKNLSVFRRMSGADFYIPDFVRDSGDET